MFMLLAEARRSSARRGRLHSTSSWNSMVRAKKISAKDLCLLCFHLSRCGVGGGQWRTFAMPPNKQTGKYKQRVDKHLPGPGPLYSATLPATVRKKAHLRSRDIVFRQVHRTIGDEVKSSSTVRAVLETGPCDNPDSVLTHSAKT